MLRHMRTVSLRQTQGFTIVELLIVIVVIAILAAISIVAYNGIQKRAQDNRTRQTAQQIVKAFKVWAVNSDKKTDIGGFGPNVAFTDGVCVNGTGGWFAINSTCTVNQVLVSAGLIPADLAYNNPKTNHTAEGGNNYSSGYMLYKCSDKWILFYSLFTPDENEKTAIRTTCYGSPTGFSRALDTYGMDGGIIFTLPT